METGGPFPDRLHVNSLVFKFMWEQTETVIRWADWAQRVVADWPDTAPQSPDSAVVGVLREVTRFDR